MKKKSLVEYLRPRVFEHSLIPHVLLQARNWFRSWVYLAHHKVKLALQFVTPKPSCTGARDSKGKYTCCIVYHVCTASSPVAVQLCVAPCRNLFALVKGREHHLHSSPPVVYACFDALFPPRASAAALGQTKAELRAYLSRYHVCYTFARDEFVPDPEAPLMRVSKRWLIDLRRQKQRWLRLRCRRRIATVVTAGLGI